MTASAGPALKAMHEQFGDRVAFLSLYVREAHPGDRYPQPNDGDGKFEHARAYRERENLPWPVAVDDIEGSLHRALDPKPNSVYVMDRDGTVAFRALWSNDERVLREGLELVADGPAMERRQRQNRVIPMTRGLGCQYELLELAGDVAKRDVLRQAPPMFAMARLAALLKPLPPLARGAVAQVLFMGASVLGGAALVRAVRRRL